MRRVAILLLVLAAAVGCRKKSAPQYYELESTHTILVSRSGDDAYATPEMDQVLAGLEAIPADTIEGPKAASLATKIKAERERVAREEKEREAALAAASNPSVAMPSTPSLFPPPPPNGANAAAAAVDAGGPSKPWGGMSSAEFQKWFGQCFTPGPNKAVSGQPEGPSQQVRDDPKCRADFGSADPATTTFYVFVKDALVGQVTETRKVTETAKPPTTQTIDDGGTTTFMVIPGAPVPEQYNGIPGMPQGAPPPAPPK